MEVSGGSSPLKRRPLNLLWWHVRPLVGGRTVATLLLQNQGRVREGERLRLESSASASSLASSLLFHPLTSSPPSVSCVARYRCKACMHGHPRHVRNASLFPVSQERTVCPIDSDFRCPEEKFPSCPPPLPRPQYLLLCSAASRPRPFFNAFSSSPGARGREGEIEASIHETARTDKRSPAT